MDILNFISWIKGKRVLKTLEPQSSLLTIGVKDTTRDDAYKAYVISVADFALQIAGSTGSASIWTNGFRPVGCLNEDIILPENANLEYTGPLSICVGKTLTVPVGTTLTVV